jgi:hypothetical protein
VVFLGYAVERATEERDRTVDVDMQKGRPPRKGDGPYDAGGD